MPTPSEIDKHHGWLESDLRTPLGQRVRIEHLGGGRWARACVGGEVGFHLRGDHDTENARRTPVVGLLRTKSLREAVELHPAKPQPWVGWYEKWMKQPDDGFALLSAGWTVFWGQPGDGRKVQLLRAEWDGKNFLDGGKGEAAQPHWHVDPPLPLWELAAPGPSPTGELRELTAQRETRLSMKAVHLAMGGWANHDAEAPLCWQVDLASDLGQLRRWAVRTLAYLQTQAHFLKLSLADAW